MPKPTDNTTDRLIGTPSRGAVSRLALATPRRHASRVGTIDCIQVRGNKKRRGAALTSSSWPTSRGCYRQRARPILAHQGGGVMARGTRLGSESLRSRSALARGARACRKHEGDSGRLLRAIRSAGTGSGSSEEPAARTQGVRDHTRTARSRRLSPAKERRKAYFVKGGREAHVEGEGEDPPISKGVRQPPTHILLRVKGGMAV